ncbi:putative rpp14 pop5 family protein [Venturia nashicola]|uniref:Ribonuclease P/MRP protein subunit POP5 n=1 Tax=Venturia nashicola TaxID=86259 RepID=A0A4Z1PSC2_9PEZI|nr:putative rpp14 pop5 family protein [Venturia nashicola]TLD38075.1 putative rpp14 pop5 family protein [Venturia nashicola]
MVRIKHRYLLINILYPGPSTIATRLAPGAEKVPDVVQFHAPTSDLLDQRLLAKMIREGVGELFGEWGVGMIGGSLKVIYLSPATSTAIIRVSRDHYRLVWAALTFVTKLPKPIDQHCCVRVVRCSGTIKKAEEEAVRRAREFIVGARLQGTGSGEVGKAKVGVGRREKERDVGDVVSESESD